MSLQTCSCWAALSVWRITHLLHAEPGPEPVSCCGGGPAAGPGLLGQALDCFYCLSLWTAVPLALWLGAAWQDRALLWPALSAGAIVLEEGLRHLRDSRGPALPHYLEDAPPTEPTHVQLPEIRSPDLAHDGASHHPDARLMAAQPSSRHQPRARCLNTPAPRRSPWSARPPGTSYRFAHPGARLAVLARDAQALARVPNLKFRDQDGRCKQPDLWER